MRYPALFRMAALLKLVRDSKRPARAGIFGNNPINSVTLNDCPCS
jgi:hypothetical protein